MRVIASSIRKGNVIEQDGKLYVVLSAENIHPGKGTPVSQIEMRRISDGVKVSERYKTTDQVEKATVEERNFTYLYEDGGGYHFMNPETYDQVQVPRDIVGTSAPYLQENMTVKLLMHDVNPVAMQLPQRVTLEVVELPAFTLPKFKLAGLAESVTVEATPEPVKAIVAGELGASLAMLIVPERLPAVVGANAALMLVLAPTSNVAGVVSPLTLNPVPLTDNWEMVSGAFPVFVSVKACDLVWPSTTLPNE